MVSLLDYRGFVPGTDVGRVPAKAVYDEPRKNRAVER
jgi:hypothetical protein